VIRSAAEACVIYSSSLHGRYLPGTNGNIVIDLHLHTSHSIIAKDTYLLRQLIRNTSEVSTSCSISEKDEPERMIEEAARKGLTTVAITDHWSFEGFTAAHQKAVRLGIECLPGIEIAATLKVDGEDFETHLLGYCFSLEDAGLLQLCADAAETCALGAKACVKGLPYIGADISKEVIECEIHEGLSGWAIRRILVEHGLAQDKVEATRIQQRAVRRGLEADARLHLLNQGGMLAADGIIRTLHHAGASVFMAHPFWLTKPAQGAHSKRTVWRHIEALLDLGIDGLEVYAPGHSAKQTQALINFCRDHGIPASGGSDSHNAEGLALAQPVCDEVLTSIKRHRAGLDPWGSLSLTDAS
jgi:3',5'-nucleoside bisphosphate phosphatase